MECLNDFLFGKGFCCVCQRACVCVCGWLLDMYLRHVTGKHTWAILYRFIYIDSPWVCEQMLWPQKSHSCLCWVTFSGNEHNTQALRFNTILRCCWTRKHTRWHQNYVRVINFRSFKKNILRVYRCFLLWSVMSENKCVCLSRKLLPFPQSLLLLTCSSQLFLTHRPVLVGGFVDSGVGAQVGGWLRVKV